MSPIATGPPIQAGYEMFRRVVLHLSAIQDQDQLHAEPLTLEHTWTIPAGSVTAEGFQALEKEFSVLYNSWTILSRFVNKCLGPFSSPIMTQTYFVLLKNAYG